MKSIFLFAGEKSGDLHGEKLVLELRRAYPKARIYGVGGLKMRAAGLETLIPMEKFEVMGFIDVFFALPRLFRSFFSLKKELLKNPPDTAVFIDYPGFSLALAKSLRKNGFKGKLCHYICPSVWAWGKKRIPKMEKILDHLFVIFPFETSFFDPKKLQVNYVGHPLTTQRQSKNPIDIDEEKKVVAIFPGSRREEIQRNFPLQLKVAKRLLNEHPNLFFVVSVADPSFSLKLDEMMKQENFISRDHILFVDSTQNQALMKRCHIALAKSGTNNLELALHKVPTVVTYGIGPMDLFIAKNILKIRLPYYCIVNIIANKQVYPELIGPNYTEESLFKKSNELLTSDETFNACRKKCEEIGTILEKKYPEKEIVDILKNEKKPV